MDASVAAFRSDAAYVTVWRTIHASPTFRTLAASSDERVAQVLETLPLLATLPRARCELVLRGAIRLSNTFLDWVLETPEPAEAARLVRELERALVAYLGPDLDQATAAAAPGHRLPRR